MSHSTPVGGHSDTSVKRRIGQYELIRFIGKGGMGAVYLARHINLHKTVAVKLLNPQRIGDESAINRLYREMGVVGRLEHPNIVNAIDGGCFDDVHCLVMEYLDGNDVAAVIKQHGALNVADACEIIRQAANGLEYIAQHGLVHRDIKPSNLMLAGDNRVKILDLGLARWTGVNLQADKELTASGIMMGTFDYVSPEQISDASKVDIRSDIYSLGCTLYCLLTGAAPFAHLGSNPAKKIAAHTSQPFESICVRRNDLPRDLDRIISKSTAKRPEDRFQRPAEMAEALAPFCQGSDLVALFNSFPRTAATGEETASVTPVSRAETSAYSSLSGRKHPPILRRHAFALLIAVSLGIMGVALGISIYRGFIDASSANARDDSSEPTVASVSATEEDGERNAHVTGPTDGKQPADPGAGPVDLAKPPFVELRQFVWPPNDSTSTWEVLDLDNAVRVYCNSIGGILLATTSVKNLELSMKLHQPDWSGECGVFFGQKEIDYYGKRRRAFKVLKIGNEDDGSFEIWRSLYILKEGHTFHSRGQLRSMRLLDANMPIEMRIQIVDGRLASVQVNRDDCPELFENMPQSDLDEIDDEGMFGLFVSRAAVVFSEISVNGRAVKLVSPR